jgi:hypothetical protein
LLLGAEFIGQVFFSCQYCGLVAGGLLALGFEVDAQLRRALDCVSGALVRFARL